MTERTIVIANPDGKPVFGALQATEMERRMIRVLLSKIDG